MTHHEDIPPLLPPHLMPPITDQRTLENTWRALMGKLGFSTPQVWILLLDGQQPMSVAEIVDVPISPSPDQVERLQYLLDHVAADGISCAFLYARPGGPTRTVGDLAWAHGLASLSECTWPVHLANDVELRVAAPDDLAAAG